MVDVLGVLPFATLGIEKVTAALIVADLVFGPDGALTSIQINHQYVAVRRESDPMRTTLICPNNRAA